MLATDDSVTVDEARAYINDITPFGVTRWIQVLRAAHEQFGKDHAQTEGYGAAVAEVLEWNGELAHASKAALKYAYWREQLEDDHGADVMNPIISKVDQLRTALGDAEEPLDLEPEQLEAALGSFVNALVKITRDFGSLDATYGDRFRVGRGDASWPLSGGGNPRHGLSTLRNIGYGDERDDHTRWGQSGQTSTQIVVLSKPVQSWSYVPLGQSDRADSPHFRDQAERLFSPGEMKDTWWSPEELAGHIESRTELENAG